MNTGKRSEHLNSSDCFAKERHSNMNRNIAIWIIPVALFTIRHVTNMLPLLHRKHKGG